MACLFLRAGHVDGGQRVAWATSGSWLHANAVAWTTPSTARLTLASWQDDVLFGVLRRPTPQRPACVDAARAALRAGLAGCSAADLRVAELEAGRAERLDAGRSASVGAAARGRAPSCARPVLPSAAGTR